MSTLNIYVRIHNRPSVLAPDTAAAAAAAGDELIERHGARSSSLAPPHARCPISK